MKVIYCGRPGSGESLSALYNRPDCPKEIETAAAAIVEEVRQDGDAAVCRFLKKFDGQDLTPAKLRVTEAEFEAAEKTLDETSKAAIDLALSHIQDFARSQMPHSRKYSPRDGVVLGEQFTPMERVGCYIPGGTAPLVSTVLHTAGIAAAAGVKEIVAATPPRKDGSIHAATLYAMKAAGIREVYRMGGAYAIAALAYGTETIPRVDKIVGPGNAYVAEAKRQVYGVVSIDMIAGPSEIMVVADGKSNPAYLAADLLSQAEHDKVASAVLVTDSMKLAKAVSKELEKQLPELERYEIARASIDNNGKIIVADDLKKAIDIANEIAPEHLELCVDNPFDYLDSIRHAGSVFMGRNCPEALGDYLAGPNHTLPTQGTAKFSSPLSVDDFVKKTQYTYFTRDALARVAEDVDLFARKEGLTAHARSATIRTRE